MSELRAAALDYASQGIRVFPIEPRGKRPLIKDNLNQATTNADQIDDWWEQWPDANIGIVCGDGLAVLDVDVDKSGDRTLAQILGGAPLPTRLARTGSGGYHLYLQDDPENPLGTSAGSVGRGLDVRAAGTGYVVAPPSIHENGQAYEWMNELPPAPVPDWLRTAASSKQRTSPLEVDTFEDGERNQMLARVGGLLRHRGFSESAILQALLAENEERCNPPLPEGEVRTIAHSVSRYEPSAVHDEFRPGPIGAFEPDEGFTLAEAPASTGVLALVESLRTVDAADFLARLDRVYDAVGEIEDTKQRIFATVLANRYLRERLGGSQSMAMFQALAREDRPPTATMNHLLEDPTMLEPPDVVVPRLAYRGRLTMIAGPSKGGKSTLAAHAVARVTQGTRFLGDPVTKGTVILVTPDESLRDTLRRLAELGADPDRVIMFNYYQPTVFEDVQREIERNPDVSLVVFDSLQAVARLILGVAPGSGDASGWSEVVRPMADLAHTNDVAVLLLHHVRKSDGAARDSGEITAAVDGTFTLKEPGQGFDPRVRFLDARTRWPSEDFAVQLVEGEGYHLTAGSRRLSMEAQVILFLQDNPGSSQRQIRMGIPGRNEDIARVLEWLEEEGHVRNQGTDAASSYVVITDDPVAAFETDAEVHDDRGEDDETD